jgi:hypothetical protein
MTPHRGILSGFMSFYVVVWMSVGRGLFLGEEFNLVKLHGSVDQFITRDGIEKR